MDFVAQVQSHLLAHQVTRACCARPGCVAGGDEAGPLRPARVGQGNPGRAAGGAVAGCRISPPATCCARRWRAARKSASRRGPSWRAGELVPDEVVIGIVAERLAEPDAERGFVLDGFPRTVAPGRGARRRAARGGPRHRPRGRAGAWKPKPLTARIAGRFACGACGAGYHDTFKPVARPGICDRCGGGEFTRRKDDRPETVRERLAAYHARTAPLLPWYESARQARRGRRHDRDRRRDRSHRSRPRVTLPSPLGGRGGAP